MSIVVAAVGALAAFGLAQAGVAGAVTQQTLVGAWSGPAFGDSDCGAASAEYAFSPDGTYRYTANYDNCDRIFIDGHYALQADGGVLQTSMELCGEPGCPDGPPSVTTSISSPDPDTIVLDGRYTFHRMHD